LTSDATGATRMQMGADLAMLLIAIALLYVVTDRVFAQRLEEIRFDRDSVKIEALDAENVLSEVDWTHKINEYDVFAKSNGGFPIIESSLRVMRLSHIGGVPVHRASMSWLRGCLPGADGALPRRASRTKEMACLEQNVRALACAHMLDLKDKVEVTKANTDFQANVDPPAMNLPGIALRDATSPTSPLMPIAPLGMGPVATRGMALPALRRRSSCIRPLSSSPAAYKANDGRRVTRRDSQYRAPWEDN